MAGSLDVGAPVDGANIKHDVIITSFVCLSGPRRFATDAEAGRLAGQEPFLTMFLR